MGLEPPCGRSAARTPAESGRGGNTIGGGGRRTRNRDHIVQIQAIVFYKFIFIIYIYVYMHVQSEFSHMVHVPTSKQAHINTDFYIDIKQETEKDVDILTYIFMSHT